MTSSEPNRQVRKTRAAILEAFQALVIKHRYSSIRVADIIRRADVGRSTFYEHFRNKDDVLRQSLSDLLSLVAGAIEDDCEIHHLQCVLEHFQEHRRLARGLLNGPSSPQVIAVLANLIEARLSARCQGADSIPALPLDLAAAQAAEAQLGLVRAWLNQGASCSTATVACAMHQTAAAATRALFSPATSPVAQQ